MVDESGFELLPARVRTWAPLGQTPVLRVPYVHEHLTVISGITPDGRLFQQVLDHGVRSVDSVRFLWHLLQYIEGKLLVLWDGLPAHRAEIVRQFLKTEHGKRVHLEAFPAYAPDLNPDEGVWKLLKYGELGNVCCDSLVQLRPVLKQAMQRLRQKPHLIRACFEHCGFV